MPQLSNQSKHIFLALSANPLPSDQIKNCCKYFEKYTCIYRLSFNSTDIAAKQPNDLR